MERLRYDCFYRVIFNGRFFFPLVIVRQNAQASLGGLDNAFKHAFIIEAPEFRHFGKMPVPAPSRVRIDFEKFRVPVEVKPPVEPAVVLAFKPLKKLEAAFLQKTPHIVGKIDRN